jgi:ABC-2 type transport system permease protein
MNRTIWKRAVHDAQWLLAACAVTAFGFCWLFVWLVGRLETSRFREILKLLPDEFETFLRVPLEHLTSFTGRIAVGYDDPVVYLTVCVYAVARASDAVSGPLGRGTLEMTLSQPVSRVQVLLSNAVVTAAGVGVISAAAWLGTWAGVSTVQVKQEPPALVVPLFNFRVPLPAKEEEPQYEPISLHVSARHYLPAAVSLTALGIFMAGFTTALSAVDRYRWRTIAVIAAFFVTQMILKAIAVAVSSLSWLAYFTVFGSYEPQLWVYYAMQRPETAWSYLLLAEDGSWSAPGPLMCHLTLIGLGAAAYGAAFVAFCRRDLPAPM